MYVILKCKLTEFRKTNKHKSQASVRGFSELILDDNVLRCLTCTLLPVRDNCKNMPKTPKKSFSVIYKENY